MANGIEKDFQQLKNILDLKKEAIDLIKLANSEYSSSGYNFALKAYNSCSNAEKDWWVLE